MENSQESGCDLIQTFPGICLETQEIHKNSLTTGCLPSQSLTTHLQNYVESGTAKLTSSLTK